MERLEDINARIQDLTTNRGDASRRSQKERAELRTTFRSILTAIEVCYTGDVRRVMPVMPPLSPPQE